MRLLELQLLAYGPFEGQVIELSRERGVVDVVFGGNEAGKSTSLRALEALFFGMEQTTADAHRHPYGDLRVGGKIEAADGSVLELVRRKARKASLRDASDAVVDEAVMKRLLSGVDRELFRALWGLDHVRLRDGARAIFAGKGGVGETLFEAGLAGAGASRLAQTLQEEAESIWSPRATTRPLAEALRSLAENRRLARRDGTTFEGYKEQVDGIEGAKREKETLEIELRTLDEERRRLDRALRVLRPLRERAALVLERASLGEVPILPIDSTRERQAASAALSESAATLAEIDAKLGALATREVALGPARTLELDPADAIDALSAARGSVRTHRDKADALRVEKAQLAAAIDGGGDDLSDERARRLITAVKRAATARAALVDATAALREAEATRAVAARRVEAASDAPTAPLEQARLEALRAIERREAGRAAKNRARLARSRAEAAFMSLGLFEGTLDELAARRAPAEEEVSEDSRRVERCEEEIRLAERELDRARTKLEDLDREERALLAEGDVPTEADLVSMRAHRDAAIAAAFEAPSERRAALASVAAADACGDRLRRESSRVSRFAIVLAEREAVEQARSQTSRRVDAARLALGAALSTAAARFTSMGVRALEPSSMRDWLRRRAAIVSDATSAAADEAAADGIEESERVARERLARALDASPGATLDALLERTDAAISRAASAARERDRAKEALSDAELAIARLSSVVASRTVDEDAAARASARELSDAGLATTLDEEATLGVVDDRRRARTARAALARIDAELALAKEAEHRLESIVARLEASLGTHGGEDDLLLRAERLGFELRRARERNDAARAIDGERGDLVRRRDDAIATQAKARATLDEHVSRAGVSAVSALEEAERRSERARDLALRIAEVESTLHAAGDGASLEALELEVGRVDEEAVLREREELEERREDVTRRRDEAFHREVASRMGLDRFEESNAADHAARAEIVRARARSLAARYVRLRLSSLVLEREMETYRRAFQDPLLSRASELFATLTRGTFEALVVRLDDKDRPELACVRSGREIGVEGLSDGTRDQLYLALRLATIERHAKHADPLPLVLDDVLVHFDDERSGTALELFAEIARTVQVLLFTHHERVAEIARDRLGARAHVVALDR